MSAVAPKPFFTFHHVNAFEDAATGEVRLNLRILEVLKFDGHSTVEGRRGRRDRDVCK